MRCWLVTAAVMACSAPAGAQPFDEIGGAFGLPSVAVAPGYNSPTAAATLADVDADGDLDLVRSGGSAPPALYRRSGPLGAFSAVAGAFVFPGGLVPSDVYS